jgi:hypothetical protein
MGLREWDNLRPNLFNLFINDLPKMFYKSYYVIITEQRTKTIDVYLLFKNEFQREMKENKILEINSLLKNI